MQSAGYHFHCIPGCRHNGHHWPTEESPHQHGLHSTSHVLINRRSTWDKLCEVGNSEMHAPDTNSLTMKRPPPTLRPNQPPAARTRWDSTVIRGGAARNGIPTSASLLFAPPALCHVTLPGLHVGHFRCGGGMFRLQPHRSERRCLALRTSSYTRGVRLPFSPSECGAPSSVLMLRLAFGELLSTQTVS